VRARIKIDRDKVAEFCRSNRIRKLSLFGSVLRSDFSPKSDVDVLVEFEPDARVGLIKFAGIEIELSRLLGRKVDLSTPNSLSKYFRDQVINEAQTEYRSRISR